MSKISSPIKTGENPSFSLIERANLVIPGGVNSPVRAFNSVDSDPIFIRHGKGAKMYDVDNKEYIDYICSWGPLILGHAHPAVVNAVKQAAEDGLSFGAATTIEVDMAEKVCALMPSIDMVRMVNSGTEATMSTIRLARGFTGRDKIIKFTGCYHGHSDSLLVDAGSGLLTLGIASSPGVPNDVVQHTLVATFNDLDSVSQLFEQHADDIACIIVEPVAGNMNCIPGDLAFLQGLRALCDQYQSLLIFDEVMSGFRVGLGGAQALYDITPDLTTLGKVIGGGLPVGAFGGRKAIMEYLAPIGPVYQAGTLSGNPLAMAAGLATLNEISNTDIYTELNNNTAYLTKNLKNLAEQYHIPFAVNQICSMFGFFFNEDENITQYQQAVNSNIDHFKQFFHGMLQRGIYFAPSAFETGFTSIMHNKAIIDQTLNAANDTFKELR